MSIILKAIESEIYNAIGIPPAKTTAKNFGINGKNKPFNKWTNIQQIGIKIIARNVFFRFSPNLIRFERDNIFKHDVIEKQIPLPMGIAYMPTNFGKVNRHTKSKVVPIR